MKKVKLIMVMFLSLGFLIGSCEKEDVKPCNCGVIANDGIDDGCYWLEIRNDCTNNLKTFCFDQDVWMNNHVGKNFCVTNETKW